MQVNLCALTFHKNTYDYWTHWCDHHRYKGLQAFADFGMVCKHSVLRRLLVNFMPTLTVVKGTTHTLLDESLNQLVIRCPVVLQIGLAVGDIAEVQKHALLKRIAMQVSVRFHYNLLNLLMTPQLFMYKHCWFLRTQLFHTGIVLAPRGTPPCRLFVSV